MTKACYVIRLNIYVSFDYFGFNLVNIISSVFVLFNSFFILLLRYDFPVVTF